MSKRKKDCRDKRSGESIAKNHVMKYGLYKAPIDNLFANGNRDHEQESYQRLCGVAREKSFRELWDDAALIRRQGGEASQSKNLIQNEENREDSSNYNRAPGHWQNDAQVRKAEMANAAAPQNEDRDQPLKSHRGKVQLNTIERSEFRPLQQDANPRVAAPRNKDGENQKYQYVIPVHEIAQHYAVK